MLIYKLHKTEGDLLFFNYYPEGNGAEGTVSINKNTGETAIIKPSEDDFGNRFAFKLVKRLKEFFEANDYKEEGIIAWY